MNMPKEIRRYCPKCKKHTLQKVSLYKAGKRRGSAIGERRHAEDKKGYGGQKFMTEIIDKCIDEAMGLGS